MHQVGWHLCIQATALDPAVLSDESEIATLMRELVALLDHVQIVIEPQMFVQPEDVGLVDTDPMEGSVTAFLGLTGGHVVVHTWPVSGRFTVDVFLSDKFDAAEVTGHVTTRLEAARYTSTWLERTSP